MPRRLGFEVTEIDPLRAVALRQISASWGGSGATRYTFTPVDGGTRVDWTHLKRLMESGQIRP